MRELLRHEYELRKMDQIDTPRLTMLELHVKCKLFRQSQVTTYEAK